MQKLAPSARRAMARAGAMVIANGDLAHVF